MIRFLAASFLLCAGVVEAQDVPSAVVRFEVPFEYQGRIRTKIGSGVHIGNGFILTAEHVADKSETLPFQMSTSRKMHDATVLWTNHGFDIALVHAPDMVGLPARDLSCRAPIVGEPVMAVGNLHGLRWFRSQGHVATEPDELQRWKTVYALSGPIAGGMSGGPVFDFLGDIIGIVVAGPESEAFGFAVPGPAICKLLGRV